MYNSPLRDEIRQTGRAQPGRGAHSTSGVIGLKGMISMHIHTYIQSMCDGIVDIMMHVADLFLLSCTGVHVQYIRCDLHIDPCATLLHVSHSFKYFDSGRLNCFVIEIGKSTIVPGGTAGCGTSQKGCGFSQTLNSLASLLADHHHVDQSFNYSTIPCHTFHQVMSPDCRA